MSFKKWLREQVERGDSTGKFARAAARDTSWPRGPVRVEKLERHVARTLGVEAVNPLRSAYEEFEDCRESWEAERERVEAERRAEREKAREQDLSPENVRDLLWQYDERQRAAKRRRELRAEWHSHHEHLRSIHAELAAHHERAALALVESDTAGGEP